MVKQDSRNAEEAHRKGEEAEYARSLEEKRKAEESHRQALEQEEERRHTEQEREESRKREHRACERRERERHKREASSVTESVESNLAERLQKRNGPRCVITPYRWNTTASAISRGPFLRTSRALRMSLKSEFCPLCAITAQASSGSRGRAARSVCSEMLRWLTDKFKGDLKVLDKVVSK